MRFIHFEMGWRHPDRSSTLKVILIRAELAKQGSPGSPSHNSDFRHSWAQSPSHIHHDELLVSGGPVMMGNIMGKSSVPEAATGN